MLYFLLPRALKSVLVIAGSLKHDNPGLNEDVVFIQALRDSNLPKFLAEDSNLFQVRVFNNLFCNMYYGLEMVACSFY
jgi:dynein heavy chain